MATVGLSLLVSQGLEGAAISETLASVLTTVGATVGGIFDSQILFPTLFGSQSPNIQGPRVGDFNLQSTSEGSSIKFGVGNFIRTSGTIIWMSDVRTQSTKQGKGLIGGASGQTTNKFFIDVAIGFLEGPIRRILKISADGKLIFRNLNSDETINVTSKNISAKPSGSGNLEITYSSPPGGADLTQFKKGLALVVSGFTNASNNGSFTVKSTKSDTPSTGWTQVIVKNSSGSIAINESSGPNISMTQTTFTNTTSDEITATALSSTKLRLDSSVDGPDLSLLVVGKATNLSGFTGTASVDNQQNLILQSVVKNSDGSSSITVKDGTGFVDGNAIHVDTISITQDLLISKFADAYVLHNGDIDLINNSQLINVGTGIGVGFGNLADVMVIGSEPNGPDLTKYNIGLKINLQGFTDNTNNGDFIIVDSDSGFDMAGSVSAGWTRLLVRNRFFFVPETSGSNITLSQLTIPLPDSLIEATEGAGLTSANRGLAYVVINNLELTSFGNRLPQFEIVADATLDGTNETIDNSIRKIMNRAGFTEVTDLRNLPSEDLLYDVIDAPNDDIIGYVISGDQETRRIFDPLLSAYAIGVRESDGILHFFDKSKVNAISIDETKLAAHIQDSDAPRPVTMDDIANFDLPSQVVVKYLDKDLEGQQAAQSAKKAETNAAGIQSVQIIDIPIIMSASKALAIAETRLWGSWSGRNTATFFLPPSDLKYNEGDILSMSIFGSDMDIRIARKSFGSNGITEYKGVLEDTSIFTRSTLAEKPNSSNQEILVSQGVTSNILHIPAFRTNDNLKTNSVYVGISRPQSNAIWLNGDVFVSLDDITFNQITNQTSESTIGVLKSSLGDGPIDQWDNVNTIDISLIAGAFVSVTELDVLNGANLIAVGDELIQFQNALQDPNSTGDNSLWRLSKLRRGIRDTDDQTKRHWLEQPCALLDSSIQLSELPFALSEKQVLYAKDVHSGAALNSIDSKFVMMTDQVSRTFIPQGVDATIGTNNSLFINIIFRSNAIFSLLFQNPPSSFGSGGSGIQVINPPSTTNSSTNIVNNGDGTATYTPSSFISNIRIGDFVTIEGFTNEQNNGIFRVKNGNGSSFDIINLDAIDEIANAIYTTYAIKRSLTHIGSPRSVFIGFEYTQAGQSSDGFTTGDDITLRVLAGNSRPLITTVKSSL